MSSINSMKLTRMKNDIHLQFHERVNRLMSIAEKFVDDKVKPKKNSIGIKKLYELYNEAYKKEATSMTVVIKSDIIKRLSKQDKVRDSVYNGFIIILKANKSHFDAKSRIAANKLLLIFKHCGDISSKSPEGKTAAFNEILREFERTEHAEAIKTLQLFNWKKKFEEENAFFNKLMFKKYSETIGRTPLLTKYTRIETDKYYRGLVAELNHYISKGVNTPEFNKFIDDLNAIIKHFSNIIEQDLNERKNAKDNDYDYDEEEDEDEDNDND